jgi:hypothetical protein
VSASLRLASYAALPALALAAALVPWPPALVEHGFSSTIYPALQPRLTGLTNLVPIACLDVLLACGVLAAGARAHAAWRGRRSVGGWAVEMLARASRAAAVCYLAFLAAWGLNYQRMPAAQRFSVDETRITTAGLRAIATRSVAEVNRLAGEGRDDRHLEWPEVVADLRPAFADATRASGTAWGVEPAWPKPSLAARTFPWAAVDGMVNPFGLEVVVNPEVLPFERPFVLAHEWAHLAGHADESEASFVGLLTCLRGTREAQYSGWQALLIHAVRGVPPAERRTALDGLAPGPAADLRAIGDRVARAQPMVHAMSWGLYDRYLKANRVEAGVESYDAVVRLVLGSPLTASLAGPAAAPVLPR